MEGWQGNRDGGGFQEEKSTSVKVPKCAELGVLWGLKEASMGTGSSRVGE